MLTEQDELFLVAKVNLAEALATDLLVVFSKMTAQLGRNDPKDVLATIENNMQGRIATRLRVVDGDINRIDPLKVQAEMLRQSKTLFARAKDALDLY